MPKLAKYVFSLASLPEDQAAELRDKIIQSIETWLSSKGAEKPLQAGGTFYSRSKGNAEGTYRWETSIDNQGKLDDVALQEFTSADQLFETKISILATSTGIYVYITLSIETLSSTVAPIVFHARCPKIVRDIIALSKDWKFQDAGLPKEKMHAHGDIEGLNLAEAISDKNRVYPIVVVSELDDEELWPDLSDKLASDLEGLANVYTIDDDATWALTSKIGKVNSCYLGAVRLYWPSSSSRVNSVIWTASRLLPRDESEDTHALEKFRNDIRNKILGASAESLSEPPSITRFRDNRDKNKIAELITKGNSAEEIINLRIQEKREFEIRLEEANNTISKLYRQLQEAQQTSSPEPEAEEAANEDAYDPPKPGEIRFYKKTHSKNNYDVLVRIANCEHTSWQNAAKADKAKKGILRLEGSGKWSQVQHCGSCEGGGVWRVKW